MPVQPPPPRRHAELVMRAAAAHARLLEGDQTGTAARLHEAAGQLTPAPPVEQPTRKPTRRRKKP